MTTRKHWTKFLIDAGRPIKMLGDEQESLSMRIDRIEGELKRLKQSYEENEVHIQSEVETDWTRIEISEAKLKSLEGFI